MFIELYISRHDFDATYAASVIKSVNVKSSLLDFVECWLSV